MQRVRSRSDLGNITTLFPLCRASENVDRPVWQGSNGRNTSIGTAIANRAAKIAQRDLALDRLGEVLDAGAIGRYEPLLGQALEVENREAPRLRQKLVKVVVESHFLTLKANFEYFLNRMLYCLWSSQFDQLTRRKTKGLLTKAVPLRDVAQALSAEGGKDFVIGRVPLPWPRAHGGVFRGDNSEITPKSAERM